MESKSTRGTGLTARLRAGAALGLLAITLLWPRVPGTQQVYRLNYDWSLGRHFEFSVYIVGQITTGLEGKQEIRAKFNDVWEVVEVDRAKNLARVIEKAENYTGPSFDIRSFGLPLPGPVVERLVDQTGRVATVIGYPSGHRLYLLPLVLPEVPVAVDEKWTQKMKIQFPVLDREAEADVLVVYTLEEIAKNYKNSRRNCARIRVDAKYNWQSPEGDSGITGAFQGKVYFDLVDLKIVDYQLTSNRKEFIKPDRVRTSAIQITCIAHSGGDSPGMAAP